MSTTAIFQEFSIYSIESHGVYYIFRDSSAAFIRGRRLYEDGVYLKFNLFLANNGMITYYFNFEKQKYVFSAFLKSHFLFCSQIHNLHVNTTAIHNVNKALMSDMLSWHQNWYIKKKLCLAYSTFPTTIEAMTTVRLLTLLFEQTPHHAAAFIRRRISLIFLL